MLDRLITLLGKLPTTQGGAAVAWVAILATTTRYVASHDTVLPNGTIAPHWVPDYGWLAFLLGLAGVSTAHFIGKRLTDADYTAAKRTGVAQEAKP